MRGLALVLALLPSLAAAQLVEQVEGARSVVAARYSWGSTGGDFALPVGSTVLADCSGLALQAGAACSVGAAWTVGGVPTLVPSYWRPAGGAATSAVQLGGGASVTSPTLTYGAYCVRGRTAAGVADVSCYSGGSGQIALSSGAVERVVVLAGTLDAAAIARVKAASFAAQGSLGESLTVTSPATSAALTKADGSPFVVTVPANLPSLVAGGVQVYGARVSRILQNQTFSNAVWSKNGTASCVASPNPAPDGTMTAWRCTVGEYAINDLAQSASGFTAGASLAVSRWLSPVSGSSVVVLNTNDSTAGRTAVDLSAFTGWRHITASSQHATTTAAWKATSGGLAGFRFAVTAGAAFDVWRPWQQEGALGPDAEVQASPLSVAATRLETPIPAGARWAIYRKDGTRYALDVLANASPLTVGAGQELDATGAFSSLLFCYSPDSSECQ